MSFTLPRKALAAVMAAGLLAVGAPLVAQSYNTPAVKFLQAVDKKDGTAATQMLEQAGSTIVNARELGTNRTGLHIVVARRDETWLMFLLQRGADPNLADNRGVTPLLLACRMGFVTGVEALVKNGARVDESNATGETPLISAVLGKNLALVRVLLAAGADPGRADSSGRSAADYARLEGSQSTIAMELERGIAAARARRAEGGTYGPSL